MSLASWRLNLICYEPFANAVKAHAEQELSVAALNDGGFFSDNFLLWFRVSSLTISKGYYIAASSCTVYLLRHQKNQQRSRAHWGRAEYFDGLFLRMAFSGAIVCNRPS